jgi:hypothetical protein
MVEVIEYKVYSRQLIATWCPGDLFDMLLPMLSIYQEYVRNHHYSLQVVTLFHLLRAKFHDTKAFAHKCL